MSQIYCGTEKLPKGKKLGNMEDCVKAGQVRRFGLFAIDPMLLAAKIDRGPNIGEYRDKVIALKGRLAGIKHKYKLSYDNNTKKKLEEDHRKAFEELKAAIDAYDRVKKGVGIVKKREITIDPKKIRKPKKPKVVKKTPSKKSKKAASNKKSSVKKTAVRKTSVRKTLSKKPVKKTSRRLSRTKKRLSKKNSRKSQKKSKKNSRKRSRRN